MAWHASREAQTAAQVARHDRAYDEMMRTFSRDVLALSHAVADGPILWRQRFVRTMHEAGFPLASDDIADRIFAFLCLQIQRIAHSDGAPRELASHYLDHLEMEEPHVPTEQEIAESWELESASSPEGQQFAYGGKTTDEVMRGLAGELDPTFSHDDS